MELKLFKTVLKPELIPDKWYNIVPELPEPLPPPLDTQTLRPISISKLERLFAKELIRQEISTEVFIKIPEDVREAYVELGRPTPLFRAHRLEMALKTPAKIYFKYEGVLPTGAHKVNTAIAQVYYNKLQGVERVVTETGAG